MIQLVRGSEKIRNLKHSDSDSEVLSEDELLQEFTIRNNEDSDSEEEEKEMLPAVPSSSTESQEESINNTNSLPPTVSNSTLRKPLVSKELGFHRGRNYRQVFQYSPHEVA